LVPRSFRSSIANPGTVAEVIQMELIGVRVEVPANTPVVILREQDGLRRVLPILIGSPEASAIHVAIEGIVPPRPLTHDLLAEVIAQLGGEVDKIVVTEVRDHTFYAELHVVQGETQRIIGCRPSDAIALAARTGVDIYAAESLLETAAVSAAAAGLDDGDEEAILDEFRDFLDDISPEDFEA
jgi:bifunctional DNase/RNase